jgi:hypothetical protein
MTDYTQNSLIGGNYNPRNDSWTGASVRFSGFLARRDVRNPAGWEQVLARTCRCTGEQHAARNPCVTAADCIPQGEATTPGNRENVQSHL